MDRPATLMFTQQLSKVGGAQEVRATQADLDTLRVNFIPLAKMQVMVRVENLQDNFDAQAETESVDINALAQNLWVRANPGVAMPLMDFIETSVTGNMPVSEMEDRRIKWKTQSGGSHFPLSTGSEGDSSVFSLEPLRIRTFILTFKSASNVDLIQQ